MSLLDDIRKDRDAGTDGPWEYYKSADGVGATQVKGWDIARCEGFDTDRPAAAVEANARRIARVPQMEAALLAADELAEFVNLVHGSFGGGLVVTFSEQDVAQAAAALTAYRTAIGDV